jgi:hypothetical protein
MLIKMKSGLRRRGGATTVEASVVITVFLLFLFGLFEYCRFIMCLHVTTNACRDGARYAVVNLSKPTNFDYTSYTANSVTYQSIKSYVDDRVSGQSKMFDANTYKVEIFPCDNAQLAMSTPIVKRKPAASYPTSPKNPTSPYTGELAWNVATFGERIAVRIQGTYKPVLPNFLLMKSSYNLDIIVTANSEG